MESDSTRISLWLCCLLAHKVSLLNYFKWPAAVLENLSAFILMKVFLFCIEVGYRWYLFLHMGNPTVIICKGDTWIYIFLSSSLLLHACAGGEITEGPYTGHTRQRTSGRVSVLASSLLLLLPCIPPTHAHACLLAHSPVTIWFLLKITFIFHICL